MAKKNKTATPAAAPEATIPGDELVQLATRVPRWMLRDVKLQAVHQGTSVMKVVQTALKHELERTAKVAA